MLPHAAHASQLRNMLAHAAHAAGLQGDRALAGPRHARCAALHGRPSTSSADCFAGCTIRARLHAPTCRVPHMLQGCSRIAHVACCRLPASRNVHLDNAVGHPRLVFLQRGAGVELAHKGHVWEVCSAGRSLSAVHSVSPNIVSVRLCAFNSCRTSHIAAIVHINKPAKCFFKLQQQSKPTALARKIRAKHSKSKARTGRPLALGCPILDAEGGVVEGAHHAVALYS